jgi:comEA protein
MFEKWFTPQESRIILMILAALIVGSLVLMVKHKVPSFAKELNLVSDSNIGKPPDSLIESVDKLVTKADSIKADSLAEIKSNLRKKKVEPKLESININTAGIPELTQLPGIGEGKAKTIIEYRDNNGPFKSKKDFMKVKGIGQKTFDKLEKYLTI